MRVSVLASLGRVMASALGAVIVLAGAGWLAAVGAGIRGERDRLRESAAV